ncbi:unnamed protein product [Heligmosomoides polygyrus]|uniref:PPM-type phosphatase domain-containing protein n=1 Tax=Heligmosomoides polygyrus TaxID=6339 RepID=A0A183FEB0_HELPZ|nr:unnamed protein product [Heligmosomoides polygyrus]
MPVQLDGAEDRLACMRIRSHGNMLILCEEAAECYDDGAKDGKPVVVVLDKSIGRLTMSGRKSAKSRRVIANSQRTTEERRRRSGCGRETARHCQL